MVSKEVKYCKSSSCKKSGEALSPECFYIKRRIESVVYYDSLCKECRNNQKRLSRNESASQEHCTASVCTETEIAKEFLCNDEVFQNVVTVIKTLSQWFKELNETTPKQTLSNR